MVQHLILVILNNGGYMLDNIKIFKQSSVKVNDIYIDPYGIDEITNDAKFIFITHNHYDHYSSEDIDKIVNENTIFIIPLSLKNEYNYKNKVLFVEPNNEYEIENIKFRTVPMYNINKPFHKKEYNWCGYNIEIDNQWLYFAGDTDDIDEMKNIICDIIFIPIGGIYTMDVNEAIECLKNIKYKYVIPYHYGSIVGDKSKSTPIHSTAPIVGFALSRSWPSWSYSGAVTSLDVSSFSPSSAL